MVILIQAAQPTWSCASCTPEQQEFRGCDGPPRMKLRMLDEELERCPLRPVLDQPKEFGQLFAWYRKFAQGLLLDPGTILDQANYTQKAFDVIENGLGTVEQERVQEAERKAAHNQRGKHPRKGA
jgi:hypothetical protein